MDEDGNKLKIHKKGQDKLPFAVFICSNTNNTKDYMEIFTEIISNRINEKLKWR